jgi:hypothetical protein
MPRQADAARTALIRPAKRPPPNNVPKRGQVARPLRALVGPRTLGQALDQAVSARRRQEIAQQSGYAAQAQEFTLEPYPRALLIRQIEGGSLPELPDGMARAPLYPAHGAQLEISVPGCSQVNARRPPQPCWEVRAEGMAAVGALPRSVPIGRETPSGAAPPKQLRESSRLLGRAHIFAGTAVE